MNTTMQLRVFAVQSGYGGQLYFTSDGRWADHGDEDILLFDTNADAMGWIAAHARDPQICTASPLAVPYDAELKF